MRVMRLVTFTATLLLLLAASASAQRLVVHTAATSEELRAGTPVSGEIELGCTHHELLAEMTRNNSGNDELDSTSQTGGGCDGARPTLPTFHVFHDGELSVTFEHGEFLETLGARGGGCRYVFRKAVLQLELPLLRTTTGQTTEGHLLRRHTSRAEICPPSYVAPIAVSLKEAESPNATLLVRERPSKRRLIVRNPMTGEALMLGSTVVAEIQVDCARREFLAETVADDHGSDDVFVATAQTGGGGCSALKPPLPVFRMLPGGLISVKFKGGMFEEEPEAQGFTCVYVFHKVTLRLELPSLRTVPKQTAMGKFSQSHSSPNHEGEDCSTAPYAAHFAVSLHPVGEPETSLIEEPAG